MKRLRITEFGAKGSGKFLNTSAIQSAVNAAAKAGGGTVVVPPGVFLTGHFVLKSGVNLHLEANAVLLGSPALDHHSFAGFRAGMMLARNARNVSITGCGLIDGNARHFFDFKASHLLSDFKKETTRGGAGLGTAGSPDGPVQPLKRPGNMIVFSSCRNCSIEGVTLSGSAYWTVHFADCRGVNVHGVTIDNDPSIPNNDGIHMTNTRDALVRDCRIFCGDDSIAVSGWKKALGEPEIHLGFTGRKGACENISVRDCSLSSRSAAVRIWSVQTPVRNITLSGLDIRESNRGIGIFSRGPEEIAGIDVRKVAVRTRYHSGTWWGNAEPLHISAMPPSAGYPAGSKKGTITGVRVRDLKCTGPNGIVIYSNERGRIGKVLLENVSIRIRGGKHAGEKAGYLDLRPTVTELGLVASPATGLTAVNPDFLELRNVRIRYQKPMPPRTAAGPRIENPGTLAVESLEERIETRPGAF